MKAFNIAVLTAIICLVLACPAISQDKLALAAGSVSRNADAGSNSASGMTSEQADAILRELRAIRQLLERQPLAAAARPAVPPDRVEMRVGEDWHSMGRDDAPLTLVEFADYQCPYCRRFHTETFAELKKNYIDTGKVRFVSRDLPLGFHPNAQRAAEAALCAGDQGRYWEMREALILNASDLSHNAILHYAQSLPLDIARFQSCLEGEQHKSAIQKDLTDASALQISGTPTFILGKTDKEIIEGFRLVGAQPYSTFEVAIRRLLPGAAPQAESVALKQQ